MSVMEERQVLRSNLRVCKYRHDVKNFLQDLNSKETVTSDCILKLADDNDLMCLFAHGGHYRNETIYGALIEINLPHEVSKLIIQYAIEIKDEENIPCFYISAANKIVEKRIGFKENQLLGVLCRANQFKMGNPGRFNSKFNRIDLDDDEREAYDLNHKHFFNISAEFLNTMKYVYSDGKKNNLNITHFPMNCVDELARGCGQINSVVFPILNFDIHGKCYINMNQFFIFAETIGGSAAETVTNYQAFSLAQRLDIQQGMDREEAMDILEDIYNPGPYLYDNLGSNFNHFIKSFRDQRDRSDYFP